MRMIKVGDCREYNDERERELPQLLQVSLVCYEFVTYFYILKNFVNFGTRKIEYEEV